MAIRNSEPRGRLVRAMSGALLCSLLALSAVIAPSARAQATNGLLGQYYSWDPTMACPPDATMVFTPANLDFVRIDPTVDFGNPFVLPNTTPHNFAVKWTGYIVPPTSGDYQFTTRSDDGIRLWISKDPTKPVDPTATPDIDQWVARGEGADDPPVTVSMTAGQKYPVMIEFVECGGGNAARFRYIAPGATASAIVPSSMLAPPAAGADTTPPAAVTDLAAGSFTANGATLTFTAPGDNGTTGSALGYEIRYSTQPITAANFHQATLFSAHLTPKAAGTKETIALPVLDSLQNYYFAVEAIDAAGNEGGLSNVATGQTTFSTFPTLPAVVDKAVYYDPNYSTNWVNAAAAMGISDYFTGKGYKLLDATGLADFMTKHAASKVPSAVVMANDIYPDTVIDVSSGAVVSKNIINDYLNNGGRVIQYGDWPFYNIGLTSGGSLAPQPGPSGGTTILGFDVSGGTTGLNDTVSLTPIAVAMGLKSSWTSQRPAKPSDVDVVLASSAGGAAGWIKFFPTSAGPGFFGRLLDTTTGGLTADQLADGQKLAEFSGTVASNPARVTGNVTDASGNPLGGVRVTLTPSGGGTAINTTSNAQGQYSALLGPGSYTITGAGGTASGVLGNIAATGPVTVALGKITTGPNLTLAPETLPTLVKPVDKAVFLDANLSTGWINASNAQQIGDYFKGKGYTVLDAAGLGTFMKAHATSKTPSVVVMANDVYPDTVIDVSSGKVTGKNILNDYLNAGGRIVQAGDWPFYNIALSAGGLLTPNPGGGGGPTILGFDVASGAQALTPTTITPIGKALGLTGTWTSQRPTSPANVDVVLEGTVNGASGWIKFFPTSAGPGAFIRVVDTVPDMNTSTDAELADMQALAEFGGAFPSVGGGTTPALGDINGDGKVDLKDATLSLQFAVSLITPTAAQKTTGDVNKDNKLDLKDTTLILEAAVGLIKLGM